jgi:D-alanine--poly(phosphoribitol) ligase subunit 2
MRIDERIERIFRDTLNLEVPSSTTNIIEEGLLDSLSLVTLLFELENEFGISVPLEDLDLDSLTSVQRIAELVEATAAEQGVSPSATREVRQ